MPENVTVTDNHSSTTLSGTDTQAPHDAYRHVTVTSDEIVYYQPVNNQYISRRFAEYGVYGDIEEQMAQSTLFRIPDILDQENHTALTQNLVNTLSAKGVPAEQQQKVIEVFPDLLNSARLRLITHHDSTQAPALEPGVARAKFNTIIDHIHTLTDNANPERAERARHLALGALENTHIVLINAHEVNAFNLDAHKADAFNRYGFYLKGDSSAAKPMPDSIFVGIRGSQAEVANTFLEEAVHNTLDKMYGNSAKPYGGENDPREFFFQLAKGGNSPTANYKTRLDGYAADAFDAEISSKILSEMASGTWTEEDIKKNPHLTDYIEKIILPDYEHYEKHGIVKPKPDFKDLIILRSPGVEGEGHASHKPKAHDVLQGHTIAHADAEITPSPHAPFHNGETIVAENHVPSVLPAPPTITPPPAESMSTSESTDAPHTSRLSRASAGGGAAGLMASGDRLAHAHTVGERVMGGMEMLTSGGSMALEAAGKVKNAGIVGTAAGVIDTGYGAFEAGKKAHDEGKSAGYIAAVVADKAVDGGLTLYANIATVGMARDATHYLYERSKASGAEHARLDIKTHDMITGKRPMDIGALAMDYVEIKKRDFRADGEAVIHTTPVQLVENTYGIVTAGIETHQLNEKADISFRPDKARYGNLVGMEESLRGQLDAAHVARDHHGRVDYTHPGAIDTMRAAIIAEETDQKRVYERTKPNFFGYQSQENASLYQDALLTLRLCNAAAKDLTAFQEELPLIHRQHQEQLAQAGQHAHDIAHTAHIHGIRHSPAQKEVAVYADHSHVRAPHNAENKRGLS